MLGAAYAWGYRTSSTCMQGVQHVQGELLMSINFSAREPSPSEAAEGSGFREKSLVYACVQDQNTILRRQHVHPAHQVFSHVFVVISIDPTPFIGEGENT